MPKVSVIVPFYNREKYMGWCISSILNQSFSDFELLLINDGSTDGSREIAENYCKLDGRIQLINTENHGVSAARNIGIDHAQGEYIQFIDSDDWIPPFFLERLVNPMEAYRADIVFCGIEMIQKRERSIQKTESLSFASLGRECVWDHKKFWDSLSELYWNTSLMEGPCNRMYRSRLIKKNFLKFPEDMIYGEDNFFNLYCYNFAECVAFVSDLSYYYIHHEDDALTQGYPQNFFQNQMRQLELMRTLMEKNGVFFGESKGVWGSYCASHIIKVLASLKDAAAELSEYELKKEIFRIVQNSHVREAFTLAGWIPALLGNDIRGNIEKCDIGAICELYMRAAAPEPTLPEPEKPKEPERPSETHPCGMNIFFVKIMRGLQKFPSEFIKKWARIVELNLSTVGIKTTGKRILHKIFHG